MSRRTSTAQLLKISSELPARERELMAVVAKLRLATHAHLASLLVPVAGVSAATTARSARRVLARLNEQGILSRLERRVGGVRAGSAGYVYYLGPVGQRLMAYWEGRGLVRGRFRPEPGGRYVRHRLEVSELFVQARRAVAEGEVDLIGFDTEPDCWRSYLDGFGGSVMLKPDAFVRLGVGAYEDRFFVEVDLGSESRTVLAKKLRNYLDYFHSGHEQAEHGVFPRVLLLTDSDKRREALVELCARLPAEHWQLFAVGSLDQAIELMAGRIEQVSGGQS